MSNSMKEDLGQLWLSLAKESSGPVETPAPVETQPVVPTTAVETPVEPVITEPNAATTANPAATQVVTPAVTPAASLDVNGVVEDWDTPVNPAAAPAVPATPVQPVSFDFTDVAKVLGTDIKSKEDLISTISAVKSKVDELSTLPENLSKAIEISKLGGNYLEYLGVSVVDWSKEDPITLFENDVINNLQDAQGNVDYEKADRILDAMTDDEKELRGRALQRQYVAYQQNQKAQLEQQARYQRQAFEQSVKRSIEGLNQVLDFKLTPAHKEELYSDIVKGEDLKPIDVNQRILNRFKSKYFDKIDAFRKTQIKNSVTKAILDEATLPNLKGTTEQAQPTETGKKYGMDDFLNELKTKKRF